MVSFVHNHSSKLGNYAQKKPDELALIQFYCSSGKRGILSPLRYESDLKVDNEPGVLIRSPVLNAKKDAHKGRLFRVAEREGFEPPVPLGTPVFKTGVIDHSTIFPKGCLDSFLASVECRFGF